MFHDPCSLRQRHLWLSNCQCLSGCRAVLGHFAPLSTVCWKGHGVDLQTIGRVEIRWELQIPAASQDMTGHRSSVLLSLPLHAGDTKLHSENLSPVFALHQFGFWKWKDISDHELTLLLQRYYNSETAGINYVVGTTQCERPFFRIWHSSTKQNLGASA